MRSIAPSAGVEASGTLPVEVRRFLHFCRVEKGLATNSTLAYSRDLARFHQFIGDDLKRWTNVEDIRSYINGLYAAGLGTRSIARHLTTLRSFFKFLVSEGLVTADPTEHIKSPRQWTTTPRFLGRQQMEDLLSAPDQSRPGGSRDKAMLELLYASGLRVSELCAVRMSDLNMQLGIVKVQGKGGKQRLVPVALSAIAFIKSYLERGRPALLKSRISPFLFVTARGTRMTRQAF